MTVSTSLTDIHCHILPDIDDGAADWEEAAAMARLAVADGIAVVIATPHQGGSFAENRGPAIVDRVEAFQRFLDRERIPLHVVPGGEFRLERTLTEAELPAKLEGGEILGLAGHRRHLLMDFPENECFPIDRLLAALASVGWTGILAHPERNQRILDEPRLLLPMVDVGCLLQVTADSIVGAFGPRPQELAIRMIREGWASLAATDAHHASFRRPLLAEACRCVGRLAGNDTADELCRRNPARVVAGMAVEPINRVSGSL